MNYETLREATGQRRKSKKHKQKRRKIREDSAPQRRPLSLSSYHRLVFLALSCASVNTRFGSAYKHGVSSLCALTFTLGGVQPFTKALRRVSCCSCTTADGSQHCKVLSLVNYFNKPLVEGLCCSEVGSLLGKHTE